MDMFDVEYIKIEKPSDYERDFSINSAEMEYSSDEDMTNSHYTSNYDSSLHLVPYPKSILETTSNSFNCPNCSLIEHEYTGPITYEIFMKQQQQNSSNCYCNLYKNNNEDFLSSDSNNDEDSPADIVKQNRKVKSTKSPLISSSSPAWSISLHEIFKNLSHIEDKNDNPVYRCSYEGCQKTFSKLSRCRYHERIHLGIKPYACTWPDCQWKFARSDELTRHYRTHTGDKPYPCKVCSRPFARSDHLKIHMKTHSSKTTSSKE